MKDLKTTTAGAVGAAITLLLFALEYFGVKVPPEVIGAVGVLTAFVVGILAKDGGHLPQEPDSGIQKGPGVK